MIVAHDQPGTATRTRRHENSASWRPHIISENQFALAVAEEFDSLDDAIAPDRSASRTVRPEDRLLLVLGAPRRTALNSTKPDVYSQTVAAALSTKMP